MARATQVDKLRAGGILAPEIVIEEAARAKLRLELACAVLDKESGGGRNVFGHDPTIFIGAGEVTREKYAEYKRRRVASRNRLPQGVGPMQLTWWEFQDRADREGGCWKPRINIRVGFEILAASIRSHGEADGIRRYNGTGAAAEAYSRDVRSRARRWKAVLAGAQVAVPDRDIRRGAEGKAVLVLTRRLSFVPSPKTQRPYLDGKRTRMDAEAVQAVKAFQRDHGLKVDGIGGSRTARKLDRAVKAEKARRARPAAPAERETATLAELTTLVARRDALATRAWRDLVDYGRSRQSRLGTALVTAPSGSAVRGEPADALAEILLRIEGRLGTLVEIEQREEQQLLKAPEAMPTADVATVASVATATPATPDLPAPSGNGDGPPVPRALTELTDDELVAQVAQFEQSAQRARAELIERYEDVEEHLLALRPPRPVAPRPSRPAKPGRRPARPGQGSARPPRPPSARPQPRPADGTPRPRPATDPDPDGGKVVITKLGDSGLYVRRSKVALDRYLKANGGPWHATLGAKLRRETRGPKRRNVATPTWRQAVKSSQKLAGLPITGQLDGDLVRVLTAHWPRDSAAKRAVRSTPAWRTIPGQLSPNFNIKEFACKDAKRTGYVAGLMREQGLTKQQARQRAKGLAKRLEHLRKLGGNRPLTITSAYRTKAYNASLSGSATNSSHTRGYAVDVPAPRGVSLDQHRRNARKAFECGIGYYPPGRGNFIHMDFDPSLGARTW